ncbi:hypothetical protein AX15_001041 [Amanita polypyramis BW_CC]|nr:hypothetical protein AX15_001041 [Amanita polypyramis BW_CC]
MNWKRQPDTLLTPEKARSITPSPHQLPLGYSVPEYQVGVHPNQEMTEDSMDPRRYDTPRSAFKPSTADSRQPSESEVEMKVDLKDEEQTSVEDLLRYMNTKEDAVHSFWEERLDRVLDMFKITLDNIHRTPLNFEDYKDLLMIWEANRRVLNIARGHPGGGVHEKSSMDPFSCISVACSRKGAFGEIFSICRERPSFAKER